MQNSEVVWEFTVEEKNKIGEGAFSIVYKCYSKTLKKDVALKSLKSYYDKDTVDYNKEFNREITSLKEAQNCDNIIQYFGITKDSNMREYMVLQYANNGDLRGYLKANFNELKWLDQLKMAKEIASGIFHLHNKGIVHRDLHDKNVLVHGGRLIIADLGLSKSLSSTSKTDTHVGGMPGYRDPKYLNDKAYKREKPSDIYSLGVLFWELTSGNPPFMNREIDIAIHVINNGRETSIPGTPDDFVNLYKKAWHSEPEERPTIEKICLELDIQLYPKQIARGLNSLSCYNCSLEDRAYFTVRFFGGLVQDENFTKFVRQSVQTFFQGLKGLSQEEGAVRLEESRQEFVAANKVVKVIWFLVAAALEIAVISANFYFLDAVSVVLNCFSAIITFIAIAIRRENVATFAVEGIFVALKLLFMNMIPLTILFAAGNVAFAFYVFKLANRLLTTNQVAKVQTKPILQPVPTNSTDSFQSKTCTNKGQCQTQTINVLPHNNDQKYKNLKKILTAIISLSILALFWYHQKTNNATISNLIETINVEIFEKYNLWKNAKIFEAENNALKVENYALKYELSNLKTRYNDLEKDITNLKEKYVASNERKIILESQETEFKS